MAKLVYSTDPDREPERSPRRRARDVAEKQQLIYIERSRKARRGKTVTILSGFQHDPATLKKLLKEFKGLCGAGGTVRGTDTLEVQGDHRDTLAARLEKKGYRTRFKGG